MDSSKAGAVAAQHGYGALLVGVRGLRLRSGGRAIGALVLFLVLPFVGIYVSMGLGLSSPAALGPVLAPLIVGVLATRWIAVTGPRLHLFERGAVVSRSGRAAVAAWDWAEITPYERRARRLAPWGRRHHTELTLHGPDGARLEFVAAEADRLADAMVWGELPRARARLAVGPVRYGLVTITPWEFVVNGHAVPWTEITGVGSTFGWLKLRDVPGLFDLRGLARTHRSLTPHQRTVRALIEELSRQSV
jgi:hypothetical protein